MKTQHSEKVKIGAPSLSRNSQGELCLYGSSLAECTKDQQRPVYVYHLESMLERARFFLASAKQSLGSNFQVHYAMKANNHPVLLKALLKEGIGLDVVSGGELTLARSLGAKPGEILFSGVGKSRAELALAVREGIFQINVESLSELARLAQISRELQKSIGVGLRVNPNVSVDTHPHIATGFRENKFGLEMTDLEEAQRILSQEPLLRFQGLSLHIGSQIFDFSSIEESLGKLRSVQGSLQKASHKTSVGSGIAALDGATLDVGGGVGVDYHKDGSEDGELLSKYFSMLKESLSGQSARILFEPGRFLVARSGVLLTQVEYVKRTTHKTFVIVNTGMHHLLRPVLYEAYHRILPVRSRAGVPEVEVDIVGPICESADFLARGRRLAGVAEGDWLAIADAGAYGATMASDYNLFARPVELVI